MRTSSIWRVSHSPVCWVVLPAGFEILADELGGQGVGDVGGQARIGGIVEDFDQAGVGLHADLEVARHQAAGYLRRGGGLGLRQMQSLAPGGEAALSFSAASFVQRSSLAMTCVRTDSLWRMLTWVWRSVSSGLRGRLHRRWGSRRAC